jgi:hypothetical protein
MTTSRGHQAEEWVDLLRTAKQVRRTLRPVAPSSDFRRRLHDRLTATLMGCPGPQVLLMPRATITTDRQNAGLGLLVTAGILALVITAAILRRRRLL